MAFTWLNNFLPDIRLAARTLGRSLQSTLIAIASLALGLAIAASTIAVVNAYLIRTLPFPAADRLYHVIYAAPGQPEPRGMTTMDWRSLDSVIEVVDNSSFTRFYLGDGTYTQE